MTPQPIAAAIQSNAPCDEEIVADLFRLARSGRFRRVGPLLLEAQSMYPAEPAERIRDCLRQLGRKLYETDYQGYASDSRYKLKVRQPR